MFSISKTEFTSQFIVKLCSSFTSHLNVNRLLLNLFRISNIKELKIIKYSVKRTNRNSSLLLNNIMQRSFINSTHCKSLFFSISRLNRNSFAKIARIAFYHSNSIWDLKKKNPPDVIGKIGFYISTQNNTWEINDRFNWSCQSISEHKIKLKTKFVILIVIFSEQ